MTGQAEVIFRLIPLSQGQYAIVSQADYDWLMQWKWYARWYPNRKCFRAIRSLGKTNGRQEFLYMSRAIMNLENGDKRVVDHINRNTLDNRRDNLRLCTFTENQRNRGRKSLRGFPRGVHLLSPGRYQSRIQVDGKCIHLGCTTTIEAAAKLYEDAAKRYHGQFSCLE